VSQIFHRSTNTFAKLSIFGSIFIIAGILAVVIAVNRSGYVTQAGVTREQPVPFSHQHHVAAIGIDCRYCHTTVEVAAAAGIPPTKTCMNCHSQIWSSSPMLEPVRDSYRTDQSLRWTRVHDLPDFAYFDHSIHVNKGVGCSTCHGRVDRMPLVWQHASLHMEWCLDCHRQPEKYVRPRDQVFNMEYQPPAGQIALGKRLVKEYKIQSLTNCSTCHR
jgi:Cytochrome c7 and related cytochrome c